MYVSKLGIFIYLSVLLFINSAFASQNYAQQLQRLSTDEGLSNNYVIKTLEDEIGYVWIATFQGLNRFDGYEVTTFDGGVGLGKQSIYAMFKSDEGKIIVSTDFAGAYIIDPLTLKTEKIYSGLIDKEQKFFSPIDAMEQHAGAYYFGIDNQVYTYTPSTKRFEFKLALPNSGDYIRALKIYNNDLYIGASSGLYVSDIKTNKVTQHPLHQDDDKTENNINVKFLTIDPQLGLLIGTVEGMYQLAFDKNKIISPTFAKELISEYNIWDYKNTPYGEFIATSKGLFSYDRKTAALTFILNYEKSKFFINDNTINDLMIDRSGVVWLTSRSQGVFTLPVNTMRFKHIRLEGNNIINAVYQDKEDANIIWFGTDEGLTRYNLVSDKSDVFLNSLDAKEAYGVASIYDIFPSSIGDGRFLWLHTLYNFKLFDKLSGKIIENKDLIKNPEINFFGFSQIAANKYAFMSDEDFYIFDETTGIQRTVKGLKDKLDPLYSYTFYKPFKTNPDDLILGTSKSFYRFNEATQKLTKIYQSLNPKDDLYYTVENYYLDTKRNTLWLATTYEGLIAVDPVTYEKKHTIGRKNSFYTDSIYMLIADNNGYLWVTTDNGLYQINLDTLNVTSYTVKDGLISNQFTYIAGTKLKDNKIIFGSNSGALLFNPADFSRKAVKSLTNIAITDISLLSRPLNFSPDKYLNKSLDLSHEDLGLTIKFSNFTYPNEDKTYYKVTLSGPTPLEYQHLKSNHVFFSKLQPGSYSLAISAQSKEGITTSDTVTLTINVGYAPWKSPTAIAAYVILAIITLFLIFWQYRTRQLAISNAHRAAIHSQKQTELALKNNKSGVWDYRFEDRTVNTLRGSELGYLDMKERVSIDEFLSLIHPDDLGRFKKQWKAFVQSTSNQHWQAVYRLRHKSGNWLWYQDAGQIIYDPQTHQPLYLSGIYTNITEQLANEQQAKILGEAFGQINDWLIILDENLVPFSANSSFIKTFSHDQSITKVSPKLFFKAIGKKKIKEFTTTLKALKPAQNWQVDTYIKTIKNDNHPVNVAVTAVAKETKEVSYYVVVISDLTEQKLAENELRYLANFDPLTKLPNRSLMQQKIEAAIETAQQTNTRCALLFIDLDKFKPVNDSFGHAVGDKLLCNIAERVNKILDENAQLGRQSGDEFLVLIENIDSIQSLQEMVRKISNELADKVVIEDFSINISASIGVAMYPFDAITSDILIRNADVAMMQAKQDGRNDFKFFSDEMNEHIKQKLLLENDVKDAVKDNQFMNHYQPIVDIEAKAVNGVELLLRWKNNGQFVSPAVFIPIAEETGLIEKLTEQALTRALFELADVLNSDPGFYISLNLSPKHILKAHITDNLLGILANANIPPSQLKLEITESILIEDKFKTAKQLQALRSAGFKLLLDDFGTGYSSLTYLSHFPINVIKIDQSFVSSIGVDKGDESIIKTILSLAENLGLYCIAEGVETREQMMFLSREGCHVLQGYYFAKPMSADDLCEEHCFANILRLME